MKKVEEMNFRQLVLLCAVVTLSCIFLHALVVTASAAEKGEGNRSGGTAVSSDLLTGEGKALFDGVDQVDVAKEKAVVTAKGDAVIKAAGQFVHHDILKRDKTKLMKVIAPKLDELVEEFKIVSEKRGNDSVSVVIEARIRKPVVKDLLLENLDRSRIVIVTSEKSLGTPLKKNILEPELNRLAKVKGYSVVDFKVGRSMDARELAAALRSGRSDAAGKIGLYYLAGTVMVGSLESAFSQQTEDIFSAHATGQVKIHHLGMRGGKVTQFPYDGKGFGSDKVKAGIDALAKGAPKLATDAAKGLAVVSEKGGSK